MSSIGWQKGTGRDAAWREELRDVGVHGAVVIPVSIRKICPPFAHGGHSARRSSCPLACQGW